LSKKLQNRFVNENYKSWTKQDIYGFNKYEGFDVFISDIFMPNWNVKDDLDQYGHKFVTNVLMGKVVNGDVVSSEKLPSIRIVKGFVPDTLAFVEYKDCYPFIVCDTSRACTTELIYVKTLDEEFNFEQSLQHLNESYGPLPLQGGKLSEDFSSRIMVMENQKQFETFCRKKLVSVIRELICQLRSLALSYKVCFASPRNRNWWVASSDLPRLFVPRKFGLEAHHGMSMASNIFQDLFGLFDKEDLVDDGNLIFPDRIEIKPDDGNDDIQPIDFGLDGTIDNEKDAGNAEMGDDIDDKAFN